MGDKIDEAVKETTEEIVEEKVEEFEEKLEELEETIAEKSGETEVEKCLTKMLEKLEQHSELYLEKIQSSMLMMNTEKLAAMETTLASIMDILTQPTSVRNPQNADGDGQEKILIAETNQQPPITEAAPAPPLEKAPQNRGRWI